MTALTKPPGETLGFEPSIGSRADLDRAMAEAAFIDARLTELQAECDKQMKALTTKYQERMVVLVDGRWSVPFADRIAALNSAIEEYCNAHQKELVTGKGRSCEMSHGTVSWKKTPEGVKVVAGRTAGDLVEELMDQHGLRPQLHALLESITIYGTEGTKEHRTGADVLDVELTLSLTKAKLAYKSGRMTLEQLEAVGLVWDKGADKFSFKPAKQLVRTEANSAEVG